MIEDRLKLFGGERGSVTHTNMHRPNSNRQELIWWGKQARDRYKCNIDASFSSSLNKVGIEMCVRDDVGEFVLAKHALSLL
jgi:hypothetical protein